MARATPPLEITDARLTSSTCAEPDTGETEYDAGDTYGMGAEVISTTTHRTYESLVPGNVGNPLPVPPATATDNWLDIGPTNQRRMFDLLRNTATVHASPLTVVLTPGERVNTLALLGLEANEAEITVTSGGVEVYKKTYDLNTREVLNWYQYVFEPFSTKESLADFSLPPYTNAVITAKITRTSGDVRCGSLLIGSYEWLGQAQYGPESDVLNFSRILRNDFGDATLVPRRSVPKAAMTIMAPKSIINRIRKLREQGDAVPMLWTALDDSDHPYYEPLLILGIARQFKFGLDYPENFLITLELEDI